MKRFLLVGLLVVSLVGGLAPRASSQTPEDLEIIAGNLPAAGSLLVSGLQAALDTLTSTQSVVATSQAASAAIPPAGSALVDGTSVEDLALLMGVVVVPANVLEPYLVLIDDPGPLFDALDDPSMIGDAFNADDIGTLLANLPSVPGNLLDRPGGGLWQLPPDLLEGNLVKALLADPTFALGNGLQALASDTNYQPAALTVALIGLVGTAALVGPVTEIQTAVAPLFEAAEPATAPLVELFEGIDLGP